MNAVDTNNLIYAHDPRDPVKQTTAITLLNNLPNGALLWQVACEFISVAGKLRSQGVAVPDPWNELAILQATWSVIPSRWSALSRAQMLLGNYSLSFWDSLLIAVCLESGVQRLYSEDFSAYQKIDTLEIVNPFAP
jgi:predicted nucleic acid-binding protein